MRCTKCGIRQADQKFTVDRETGYCLECADLLRLGTSKEAQKMDQGVPRNEAGAQPAEEIPPEDLTETI